MTLNAYRAWLQQRERSAGTIEKYLRDTARFFRETGAPDAPPKEAVAAWRDDLARRGYCAASVNAMLAAVNGYQEFRGAPEAKARPLKRQRRVFCDAGRELTRAEYFRLLAAARQSGRKRTLLVLQTLCATGIRVSELPFITAEAVRRGRAAIRCKGKCREILLPAELCKRLGRWCSRRRIHTGPVFLSRSGRPLDRITVWKMMKALCERAGVAREKVFPHNLRHLFARTFYGLEKNLAKLADLLGHSSIETTRIYIMESGAEHRRLLDRMHLLL
ncbi:MAG TPA: tyrosine-type recombinase/integrase [Candidatus Gemmiger excrementavium]|uniref:Tyrosine-type recombinase/integrase n=1 Tax=Candidatus Gemmiger excrementavium TaxID=2838608 RepID=A0A9D2F2Y1_9FIRM|nr:tyrosine-type recombinase/integrase [Candidatus Gemmiger excrementavium]